MGQRYGGRPRVSKTVGVDIGGANLKYASVSGRAHSRFFPMWREPELLCGSLIEDLREFGAIDSLAVTMTGELADCFVDRQVGVQHIVDHARRAASQLGIRRVGFYKVDGSFCDADTAKQSTDLIAASNWHALASYVGKEVSANALLIDIGSTTTDIIPVVDGRVATTAKTDYDRLVQGSLVYVGCRRTPVCSLVDRLEFRGQSSAVMNEFFATIDDARLVLGTIADLSDDADTADGKPRTAEFAANRLARMIGLDRRAVSIADAQELANQVIHAAKSQISSAVQQHDSAAVVLSGHGPDLLELSAKQTVVKLSDQLGEEISRCAPAYAVARLFAG